MHNFLDHLPTSNEVFELLNWAQLHAVLGAIGAAISIIFTIAKIWEWLTKPVDDPEFKARIVKSPKKVVPAIRAVRLADDIREQFIRALCEQLEQLGKKVEREGDFGAKNFYLKILYPPTIPYEFRFQFEWSGYNELFVGMLNLNHIGGERLELDWNALNGAFNGGERPNKWWLWKHFTSDDFKHLRVARNWKDSDKPWVAIVDGTLASKIVEAFERSKAALEKSQQENGPWE